MPFDDELAPLKEAAWREIAALDEALVRGEIDEEGWHRAVAELVVPAYLSADTPWGQSGKSGDAQGWEYARSLLADAVDRDGTFLDVGCASGYLMECIVRWSPHRIEPYGLEISPELAELARRHGAEIRDLRKPPSDLSVPTGENLTHDATVVLTVGSDCAIGKKSVAIELDREARARGLKSVFVPTGQTGIAIAGWGIAVDAVVADFLAGAAERLVVEGARHGDLLFVEGQGSIVHPQFSGVALGLYHGSAPHLLVLCHLAGQQEIEGCPGHPIPPLGELVDLHERLALPARPARVAAVALNTHRLEESAAKTAIAEAEHETGLPVDDPVRFGPAYVLEAVLERFPSGIKAR